MSLQVHKLGCGLTVPSRSRCKIPFQTHPATRETGQFLHGSRAGVLAGSRYRPKIGGSRAPLGEGDLGPDLTHCGQGQGLPARQVSSIQVFGHNTPTLQTDRTPHTDRTTVSLAYRANRFKNGRPKTISINFDQFKRYCTTTKQISMAQKCGAVCGCRSCFGFANKFVVFC